MYRKLKIQLRLGFLLIMTNFSIRLFVLEMFYISNTHLPAGKRCSGLGPPLDKEGQMYKLLFKKEWNIIYTDGLNSGSAEDRVGWEILGTDENRSNSLGSNSSGRKQKLENGNLDT